MVCIFFGHHECYGLDERVLEQAVEELVANGVDTFYVGHQGQFDATVLHCLTKLETVYRNISVSVVLAYPPTHTSTHESYKGRSVYPEASAMGPPRFAIERRNTWMIDQADFCVCYLNHTWGGAYTFTKRAKKKGVAVISLGSVEI